MTSYPSPRDERVGFATFCFFLLTRLPRPFRFRHRGDTPSQLTSRRGSGLESSHHVLGVVVSRGESFFACHALLLLLVQVQPLVHAKVFPAKPTARASPGHRAPPPGEEFGAAPRFSTTAVQRSRRLELGVRREEHMGEWGRPVGQVLFGVPRKVDKKVHAFAKKRRHARYPPNNG